MSLCISLLPLALRAASLACQGMRGYKEAASVAYVAGCPCFHLASVVQKDFGPISDRVLDFVTEEISLRLGKNLGALLNASFGNAVELILSIIALKEDKIDVVKASIIGSILSNLLLLTLPTNNSNNFHNNTHFMTSTSLASSSSRPGPTEQCIPETIECLTFSNTVLLTAALTKDIGGLIQAYKEKNSFEYPPFATLWKIRYIHRIGAGSWAASFTASYGRAATAGSNRTTLQSIGAVGQSKCAIALAATVGGTAAELIVDGSKDDGEPTPPGCP
ncbi:hypothetical protein F5H01DRAFT_408409 [Linnemannia elongata]|nr:hypothetical protein F5H01DRAFT_408409 [Linnemannia elongata]